MKIKTSISENIFNVFNIILLSIFTLLCLYPFYYVIIFSISDPQLSAQGVTLLPRGITLFNYISIFELRNISTAFFISVSRTIVGTITALFCCSLFAYLVTKPMYFKKTIYRMFIFTMYINAGLIPTFLVMRSYGLFDSFLIYILPGLLGAFNVILIKTYIEQLPRAVEESAEIDGAGFFTIYAKIIMPLSIPILATICVFVAVFQWNSWFDAHIYIMNRDLWPMQLVLYRYLQEAEAAAARLQVSVLDAGSGGARITPVAVRMTITAVVTIPILLVYPVAQRYFTKGIMIGAVKG